MGTGSHGDLSAGVDALEVVVVLTRLSVRRWTAPALLLVWALLVTTAGPAQAATHQNGYWYSHWKTSSSTPLWNLDQQVVVEKKGRSTYWALNWWWSGAGQGGYTGLQTDGYRFDGTTGETAIFSLWNANAATGPKCGTFGGEGVGYSCRLPYSITEGRAYRLRVWKLDADAKGQWWGAWVQDTTTGKDTYIGKIRVAGVPTTIGTFINFVEYFGPAVACTAVPTSRVVWTQPAGNSLGGGRYEVGSSYYAASDDRGACTRGKSEAVTLSSTKGVRVSFGGT